MVFFTTIEKWLRWGRGSLGRDGEYWRAITRSWVRAGCWPESLDTKTRYPRGCFATPKRTTKQVWGPLASFCACTKSKSVLPPFYSIQQAPSLKSGLCSNGRVHGLLGNGVNDFRGQTAMSTRELTPSPGSLTAGGGRSDDCRQGYHKNAQGHQQHLMGSVR